MLKIHYQIYRCTKKYVAFANMKLKIANLLYYNVDHVQYIIARTNEFLNYD